MSPTDSRSADSKLTSALGDELRRAREDNSWTRADLVERMPSDIHVQTLATYEQGIRQCTVVRFVEICRALEVAAPDILGLALQRARIDLDFLGLQIDLRALVADGRAELQALRQWASNRLADSPDGSEVARLDKPAIREIAFALGYTTSELIDLLTVFTPKSVSPR